MAFWFGALGALFIGCWWQVRLLGDLRTHLRSFYGWFAAAGLIYLVALRLVRRDESVVGRRSVALLPLGCLLGAAAVCRLLMLGASPTLSDDIYRYRWDGRVQQAGFDPYAYPPSDPRLLGLRDEPFQSITFPHLRTVYPPVAQLAFRLGVQMGDTMASLKAVFGFAELVTVCSLLVILAQRGRSLLWVAAYAWHPLPILEVSGSGHNDALGMAALWMGIAAWQAGRWRGCALAWSAAFLSKFASAILAPWWWFRRAGRRWLAGCLLLSAAPLLIHSTMPAALRESLSAIAFRFESNASLYVVLAWLLGDASAARWLAAALWIGALLWWARREADPIRYLGAGLAAAALLSPVLHPWYLLWLIPCFCCWRPPSLIALTGTVVLSYTVWPGYLAGGAWRVPLWARMAEYGIPALIGLWQLSRTRPQSSWVVRHRWNPPANPSAALGALSGRRGLGTGSKEDGALLEGSAVWPAD